MSKTETNPARSKLSVFANWLFSILIIAVYIALSFYGCIASFIKSSRSPKTYDCDSCNRYEDPDYGLHGRPIGAKGD